MAMRRRHRRHLAVRRARAAVPTIGFFSPNRALAQTEWTEAFVQRLRELDWIQGRTVSIEYRWAEGQTERLAEIAAELVRLKVDVIVTQGGAAVLAAKQATSVIPIIFAVGPSALAVCRLMTNSNLVDCKTGRSVGLAPVRMLPV
jgi:ABC-type uncharacterized transport system substrate-binding protein